MSSNRALRPTVLALREQFSHRLGPLGARLRRWADFAAVVSVARSRTALARAALIAVIVALPGVALADWSTGIDSKINDVLKLVVLLLIVATSTLAAAVVTRHRLECAAATLVLLIFGLPTIAVVEAVDGPILLFGLFSPVGFMTALWTAAVAIGACVVYARSKRAKK